MTAITRPWQWQAGQYMLDTRADQDHDAILLAQDPPGCVARRSTSQSINNITFTDISFNTEVADPYGMFAATSAAINVLYDGYYQVQCGIEWASTSRANLRHQKVTLNTVEIDGAMWEAPCPASGRVIFNFGNVVSCVTGDVLRVNVWQDSGGPLNVLNVRFGAVRLFGPGS